LNGTQLLKDLLAAIDGQVGETSVALRPWTTNPAPAVSPIKVDEDLSPPAGQPPYDAVRQSLQAAARKFDVKQYVRKYSRPEPTLALSP